MTTLFFETCKLIFSYFHAGKFIFSTMVIFFVTWQNYILDHGKFVFFLTFMMGNLSLVPWHFFGHGKLYFWTMANLFLNHGNFIFVTWKLFFGTMANLFLYIPRHFHFQAIYRKKTMFNLFWYGCKLFKCRTTILSLVPW